MHRLLGVPQLQPPDFVDDLGGVRHPVLGHPNPTRRVAGQGPKSVVRVGETHAGSDVLEEHGSLEDQSFDRAGFCPVVEEA